MPNKLPAFLVWINVMSQCLFCLHTNLVAICGPLHSLQCNAYGVIHSVGYPLTSIAAPPSPFSSTPCVTICLGTERQPCGDNKGEDFTLTADSFSMCLTDCYNWVNDTADVAILCNAVMWIQGGYVPDKIRHKVTKWEGELKITPVIIVIFPRRCRSLQQFGERDKLTLHFNLHKCHLTVDSLGELATDVKGVVWHFFTYSLSGEKLDQKFDTSFMSMW